MQLNSRVLCKLPWESFRTTGSLADASYAECSDRSDFMVQNLFAHGQWTRQRTGKVKTTLHGTSWYSGTATQHYTFHGVACMATINCIHDSWCKTADKEVRLLSEFQRVAPFTVTQCHMHCRGFTFLSAAYLFSLKKQPCSHELCVDWAAHEPIRACSGSASASLLKETGEF